MVGVTLAGGALCASLSGCYSLAPLLHDPPQPPGTPQVVTDDRLVGTWQDEAGGRLTLAANGVFAAAGICGDFTSSADDTFGASAASSRTGTGTWETMTGERLDESTPGTEVTVWFSGTERFGAYAVGGTSTAPKLWVYRGDPDDYDLCVLTRPPPP
ncbi:hypothetical protein ACIP10_29130 [Streptomyces galbus]|uniref:hypothetical protein n=1 Tax=Streptomyces galbus TaxID=33898 RepID=UPI0037A218FA